MANPAMIFYDRPAIKTLFMEPGTDATQGTNLTASNCPYNVSGTTHGGSVTSDSVIFNTGSRSIKCDTGSSGSLSLGDTASVSTTHSFGKIVGDVGIQKHSRRVSFYVRFSSFPNQANVTHDVNFMTADQGTGTGFFGLSVDSIGTFKLYDMQGSNNFSLGTQMGSNGTTLGLNTWYRISVCARVTRTNVNEIRVYLNGVLDITASNTSTFGQINDHFDRLILGWGNLMDGNNAPGKNLVSYYDDIYVDNEDTLIDTGDIRVTYKLPNSNNTNNFAIAIGNNPANRWQNVNEQPVNEVNGWQENSGGPYPIEENYGIESASQGEIDISGYSGVYPSNLPTVGVSTSLSVGMNLYECGMFIAYSNTTNSLIGHLSYIFWKTISGGATVVNPSVWNNGILYQLFDSDGGNNTTNFKYTAVMIGNSLPMIFHSRTDAAPFIFHGRS